MTHYKRLLFILIFSFIVFYLQGQDSKGFSFTIEPVFQYRKSTIGEYVFIDNSSSTKTLLSDLQWNLKHIFLTGAALSFEINSFNSSLTALFGFPGSTGIMTDSDFYTNSLDPTLYSAHEAVIDTLIDVSITAGYTIIQKEKIKLNLFTSCQYNKTSATGYNGFQIDNRGSDPIKYDFDGISVISYTQYLFFAWIGTQFVFQPLKPLVFTLTASYAPYCYAKGLDTHYLTEKQYLDTMQSFFALKGGFTTAFYITNSMSIKAGIEGLFLPVIQGPTGAKGKGEAAFVNQSGYLGGTSLSEVRFSASVVYAFSR